MAERLFKAKELAELLNCNPQTIYRMADKSQIESVRVGSLRRFLMPKGEQNNAFSDRRQSQGDAPAK